MGWQFINFFCKDYHTKNRRYLKVFTICIKMGISGNLFSRKKNLKNLKNGYLCTVGRLLPWHCMKISQNIPSLYEKGGIYYTYLLTSKWVWACSVCQQAAHSCTLYHFYIWKGHRCVYPVGSHSRVLIVDIYLLFVYSPGQNYNQLMIRRESAWLNYHDL